MRVGKIVPVISAVATQITVDDPKALEEPWQSAPRRWTLGDGEVCEFCSTNNRDLGELERLRALEIEAEQVGDN